MEKKVIEEIAAAVRNEYNIHGPINNMKEIVKLLGGELKPVDSLPFYADGKLEKIGKKFVIKVDKFQSSSRLQFTIAHEIGHLFLHMGYKINEDVWNSSDGVEFNRYGSSDLENEANHFAACFLMPREEFYEVLNKNLKEDGNINIQSIADYFNVSVDAAINRGKWLGYFRW